MIDAHPKFLLILTDRIDLKINIRLITFATWQKI